VLAGDDGGLHRSGNLGDSWVSLNTGLGVMQFYAGLSLHPTSDVVVLGGTQDNGTHLRKTDSKSWTNVLGGDGGTTAIDQRAPQRMFAEFQGPGSLYLSTDGGTSFSFAGNGIDAGDRTSFEAPYLIDPLDSNHMLYATQRIYRSINGGTSWTAFSGDLTGGSGAVRALAMSTGRSHHGVRGPPTTDACWPRPTAAPPSRSCSPASPAGRASRASCAPIRSIPATVYLAVAYFGTDQVRPLDPTAASTGRLSMGTCPTCRSTSSRPTAAPPNRSSMRAPIRACCDRTTAGARGVRTEPECRPRR
jgi:hypothetical protein